MQTRQLDRRQAISAEPKNEVRVAFSKFENAAARSTLLRRPQASDSILARTGAAAFATAGASYVADMLGQA